VQGLKTRPTEENRRTVKAMAGFGVPHEQIATFLRIDAKTLRKHYRDELDRGMVEANVKVAQTLFQLATADKNVAAAIFWMKARAGWREKVNLEHSGVVAARVISGEPLTVEEWAERYERDFAIAGASEPLDEPAGAAPRLALPRRSP
jgi:hypothetical protein